MNKPLKGFITYSHEDTEAKKELRKRLAVMEQQNELVTWDDGQLTPGDEALQEDILKKVVDSDMLLYLVSAASLASKNCNKELAEAISGDKRGIPIILEHCDWLYHQLSNFEVLPDKGKPLTKWDDRSEGWQNVVSGIRSAINRIRLEVVLTKVIFVVEWLSGEGSDEVIFEGEGVTRYPDCMVLTQKFEEYGRTYYENYTLLTQHAVEGNRYIFVPLAQWGGGSGVFLDLNVVDKKTLRTVDEIALGDRTDVRDVVLADAHSETVTITYIEREVKGIKDDYKIVYDPKKAIKRHFRMIQGTLQEMEP
ncbi:toll/interleukin-1 receptor domain-containing protein [Candidatus Poribacteria bacterium]|nr:toll/interleukin-1 receptor domain-containing protein [Candidatus Poribacteria bacterium]